MDFMTDIIKDWFGAPGLVKSIYHLPDKSCDFRRGSFMMGFVANLKGKDHRFVFISSAQVGINVIGELTQVFDLCLNGIRVGQAFALTVFMGKAWCDFILFGPTITPISNRGDDGIDVMFFKLGKQVIKEIEMFVAE